MEQVDISRIRMDGGTQPRLAVDERTVAEYAAAVEQGAEFPPVDLFHDGADYWPADGFHRIKAHEKAGQKTVPANVRQGTQADAQWASYAANQQHDKAGLRRTNDDKRRAVEAALNHPKGAESSDRVIAEHVGVSHTMVAKARPQLATVASSTPAPARIGKDGKKRAAPAPKPPKVKAAPKVDPTPTPVEPPAAVEPVTPPVVAAPADPEEEHDAAEPPPPWWEFDTKADPWLDELRDLIRRAPAALGVSQDANKKGRWSHFITWMGVVSPLKQAVLHVEQNRPAADDSSPPGYLSSEGMAMRDRIQSRKGA